MKICANFRPRNRSHTSGAVFSDATLDLSRPRVFDAFIWLILDALEQQARKFRAVFRREFGCPLIQLCDGSS